MALLVIYLQKAVHKMVCNQAVENILKRVETSSSDESIPSESDIVYKSFKKVAADFQVVAIAALNVALKYSGCRDTTENADVLGATQSILQDIYDKTV